MNLRLNPLYKKLLILSIVLGPIIWLMFTEDGRRRTDLVMLHLFGKAEINLAIENLDSGMTVLRLQKLFPDLSFTCEDVANPFGDRACKAEVGAFDAIPARAFTLYLSHDRLRAAKLDYRRAYYETLKRQLTRRLGNPAPPPAQALAVDDTPVTWVVRDGLLLLPAEEPKTDADAALMWLSEAALKQRPEPVGGDASKSFSVLNIAVRSNRVPRSGLAPLAQAQSGHLAAG